mmetsp:Transcript_17632/g.25738  ORF Transcript_17632/g.25738 Transcript_17632/m.25738 type:complete len:140 (-) Transcript_17632:235-654(-)
MGFVGKKETDVEQPMLVTDAQVIPTAPLASPQTERFANHPVGSVQQYPTNVVALQQFPRYPIKINSCPECNKSTRTRTVSHPNWATWTAVIITGCLFLPLFWLPLVIDSCKQVDHYCKNCHEKVGDAKPFEGCCVTQRG